MFFSKKNLNTNPFANTNYTFDKNANARQFKQDRATSKKVNRCAKKLARKIEKSVHGSTSMTIDELKKFAKVSFYHLPVVSGMPRYDEELTSIDFGTMPKPIPQLLQTAIDAGLTVSYVWHRKVDTADVYEATGIRFSAKKIKRPSEDTSLSRHKR